MMDNFPEFMRSRRNAIASKSQSKGIEGYVFDGVDGSQMICWSCHEDDVSEEHTHDFDEYMVVVQGKYILIIDGERIPVNAGEEYFIPAGAVHGGVFVKGTRTIHAFGGHRADRIEE